MEPDRLARDDGAAGHLPSGAPCAVQLVGRPGSEAELLGLAAQLEAARPWQRTAPLE
ncbi:hypothetical protein [Streptomyces sp. F001]|uniref:hypothetical protein n=1 Tax=Streptomyces sp. F001 TaxID=1510026 RepID=UPI003209869D